MYNVLKLWHVARQGLSDLGPSLRRAFSEPETLAELERVYGPSPRATIAGLSLLAAIAGEWFARSGPRIPFGQYIDWSAVFVAVAFALLVRRHLFRTGKVEDDDFFWIAASLVPPVVICIVVSLFTTAIWGAPGPTVDAERLGSGVGILALVITRELGLAAALTIAFAALTYSRHWPRALFDLAVRLLVFRIMIWVTALVMIDIGIVGRLLGALIGGLLNIHFPEWLQDLCDQVSYAVLLCSAYLAIIGGTWTVCRKTFVDLLRTQHVDILAALQQEISPEEKKVRKVTVPDAEAGEDQPPPKG